MATLCERLGGAERISVLVEDSIDRLAVNPVLAGHFRGKDLPRLKQVGLQFLTVGAPELGAVAHDVIAALEEHGVARAEIDEIVRILNSLKGDLP